MGEPDKARNRNHAAVTDWALGELPRLINDSLPMQPEVMVGRIQRRLQEFDDRALHMPGRERLFSVDLMTALFGRPEEVVVSRPMAPLTLSPIFWMRERSEYYTSGEPRPTQKQLRNHIMRRRYVNHPTVGQWAVRLINVGTTSRWVYPSDEQAGKYATPEERLWILPKLLHEIRQGHLRIFLMPEPISQVDFRLYYTCADNWANLVWISPHNRAPYRHQFEMSDYREQLNKDLRSQISERNNLPRLTRKALDRMVADGDKNRLHERSKDTVLQLLDEINRQCTAGTISVGSGYRESLKRCRKAVEQDDEFVDGCEFKLPPAYTYKESDRDHLKETVHAFLSELGIEADSNSGRSPSTSDHTDAKAAPGEVRLGELTLDTQDRMAWYCGRPVELNAREAELLEMLMRADGQIVEHVEIHKHLQIEAAEHVSAGNRVKTLASKIRKKLKNIDYPGKIAAKPGTGYYITRNSHP